MKVFSLPGDLYTIVHGTNEYAHFLLSILGIEPEQTGRFRDCYLHKAESGELEIHIYTRNGGGNRADHETVTAELRTHPEYLRDFDADMDRTYASYVFRVPSRTRETVKMLVEKNPENALPKSHAERMQEFLRKAETNPNDPEVLRVKAAIEPIFNQLAQETREPSDKARDEGMEAARADFRIMPQERVDELKAQIATSAAAFIASISTMARARASDLKISTEHRGAWAAGYLREFILRTVAESKDVN